MWSGKMQEKKTYKMFYGVYNVVASNLSKLLREDKYLFNKIKEDCLKLEILETVDDKKYYMDNKEKIDECLEQLNLVGKIE